MGAFNFGFFCLGYYIRDKKPVEKEEVMVGKTKDALKDISKWINYNGLNTKEVD